MARGVEAPERHIAGFWPGIHETSMALCAAIAVILLFHRCYPADNFAAVCSDNRERSKTYAIGHRLTAKIPGSERIQRGFSPKTM